MLLVLVASAALALAIAYGWMRFHMLGAKEAAYADLSVMADFKAREISAWLAERRGDARLLAKTPRFGEHLIEIVAAGKPPGEGPLVSFLGTLTQVYAYRGAYVLDAQGRFIFGTARAAAKESVSAELARQAMEKGDVVFGRLRRERPGAAAPVILDIAVPLVRALDRPPVGAAVLRIDAADHLFPLIQKWPMRSDTAEFVLLQREGETVLHLNELRHRKGTALGMPVPVADRGLPSAQAVLEPGSRVEGLDYRDVLVIGVSRAIEITPWVLLAKQDADEYLAPVRRSMAYVAVFLFVLFAGAGGLFAMRWVHQRDAYEQRLRLERLERAALARHFDYGTKYARDIVLLLDDALRVIECNDAALAVYGYAREEILGLELAALRKPEARDAIAADYDIDTYPQGHLFETVHRRKDGSLFPVEASTRPFEIEGRRYCQAVVRDLTERKRAEQALRESEERFRGLVEQSLAGIYIVQDGRFTYVNPRLAEITGYKPEELIGQPLAVIVAEEDRALVAENVRKRLAGEVQSIQYRIRARRRDGSLISVGVHGTRAVIDGRPAIIGLAQDIGERERAQQQIQSYVQQLEQSMLGTVNAVSAIVEMRDPYTAGHEKRVGALARRIGEEMGLSENACRGLEIAGGVHDIGKVSVPSEILAKPGTLSEIEFEIIKVHPRTGYDVLKDIAFPWPLAQATLQHHERLDGSGYPQGLKGEEIILEARILAVADVVEAMGSHRPYRPTLGIDAALAEVEKHSGVRYDAQAVQACLRLFREEGYRMPEPQPQARS